MLYVTMELSQVNTHNTRTTKVEQTIKELFANITQYYLARIQHKSIIYPGLLPLHE